MFFSIYKINKTSTLRTTWKELKLFAQQQRAETVNAHMKRLWTLCQQLLGSEESGALIDEAALFVLDLLLDVRRLSLGHLAEMRKIFGPIADSLGKQMYAVCSELAAALSAEMRALIRPDEATADGGGARSANGIAELWGQHIVCSLPTDAGHDTAQLQAFPLYQAATGGIVKEFSMQYTAARAEPAAAVGFVATCVPSQHIIIV